MIILTAHNQKLTPYLIEYEHRTFSMVDPSLGRAFVNELWILDPSTSRTRHKMLEIISIILSDNMEKRHDSHSSS